MLKPAARTKHDERGHQPPSGGCVLKQDWKDGKRTKAVQPPSGGCVLKLGYLAIILAVEVPAAFRRLCVETV